MLSLTAPRLLAGALVLVLAGCGSTTTSGTPSPSAAAASAASSAAPTVAAPTATPAPTATQVAQGIASIPPGRIGTLPANGAIYYAAAGDIWSVDPFTGRSTRVVGGRTRDEGPWFSPDGTRFLFFRADDESIYASDAAGDTVTRLGPGTEFSNWEWSPTGDRIAAIDPAGTTLELIDMTTDERTTRSLPEKIRMVGWIADDRLLLAAEDDSGSATAAWALDLAGGDPVPLELQDICCAIHPLPNSGLIAWDSWGGMGHGRVHVYDDRTGTDRLVVSTSSQPDATFLDPSVSPDGAWILATQLTAGGGGAQLVVLASDGSGSPIPIGATQPDGHGIQSTFSPDGTKVLAAFDDGALLYSLATGESSPLEIVAAQGITWQPLPATR